MGKKVLCGLMAVMLLTMLGCRAQPDLPTGTTETTLQTMDTNPTENTEPTNEDEMTMDLQGINFHRLFSKTMYKNMRLPLWEMTFTKDFITDTNGDLYPMIQKSDDCNESVQANSYRVEGGSVSRRAGSFFPYATYELQFTPGQGACGFTFFLPDATVTALYTGNGVIFSDGTNTQTLPYQATGVITMLISCRPGAFDLYFEENNKPELAGVFQCESFQNSNSQALFQKGYVMLTVQGSAVVYQVNSFLDCGISQADMRPIRYENGDVLYENGKIYLSVTVRMEAGGFQGIFSWVPGTSQFAMTGGLFYDCGDGKWCGDVAASILYNPNTNRWKLWMTAFSHGHILGYAEFGGDPRFGINVIDVTLMEKSVSGLVTDFAGIEGDEDPDFFYSERDQKWYLAICRLDPEVKNYRYMIFQSDDPFTGYLFIGCGNKGAETGGSFVKLGGQRVFACGNDYGKRSDYRIYTQDGMITPTFDFDDGGFRGWGTIIPVEQGSRTRYFWLTFDRHNASDNAWSYGNWYCFESM